MRDSRFFFSVKEKKMFIKDAHRVIFAQCEMVDGRMTLKGRVMLYMRVIYTGHEACGLDNRLYSGHKQCYFCEGAKP
jgi:hypothetical protein